MLLYKRSNFLLSHTTRQLNSFAVIEVNGLNFCGSAVRNNQALRKADCDWQPIK